MVIEKKKKKGCGLCNDSNKNNIRMYSTRHKMTHKNAPAQVIDFCECKQSVHFSVCIVLFWQIATHFSISCTENPYKNIFTFFKFYVTFQYIIPHYSPSKAQTCCIDIPLYQRYMVMSRLSSIMTMNR